MTNKYHITLAGEPGLCKATVEECPLKKVAGHEEHFDSMEEAREAYEKKQAANLLPVLKRKKFFKKALTIGTMSIMAFQLAGCTSISGVADTPYDPDATVAEDNWIPDEAKEAGKEAVDKGVDYVKEKGPGWLEKGKELLDKGKSYMEEQDWESMTPALPDLSSSSGSTTQSTDAANLGVFFQGRSLEVSPSELETAKATLASLVERPEGSSTKYDRPAQYGKSFDSGIPGYVEHRDVPGAVFNNSSDKARVSSGQFVDPYTGKTVVVTGGDSYDADVDHLVPLAEVHRSGGDMMTQEQRRAIANDMENLTYVASSVNRHDKSDKDAANYLPSYEPSQCIYVVQQIHVKGKYNLSVDSAEKAAMNEVLNSRCS